MNWPDCHESLKIEKGTGLMCQAQSEDYTAMMDLYTRTITRAFEDEGAGQCHDEIQGEITYKAACLKDYLEGKNKSRFYINAKVEGCLVGTMCFGPLGKETRDNVGQDFSSQGEIGGLYILPAYQGQGIGSQLIHQMLKSMALAGIKKFSFDSGYVTAQKKWLQKFGHPHKIIKDYWDQGIDHMIWLCDLDDYLK